MKLIGESTRPVAVHGCSDHGHHGCSDHGHRVAFLYLLSDPLPSAIDTVHLDIDTMDHGCCVEHEYSTGTWLEMSVLRPSVDTHSGPVESQPRMLDIREINRLYPEPKYIEDDLAAQGWMFVPVPEGYFVCQHRNDNFKRHALGKGAERHSTGAEILERGPDISACVFHNAVSKEWRSSTRNFSNRSEPWFEEGDRLVIWVNSMFINRVNFVRQVSIFVDSQDAHLPSRQQESPRLARYEKEELMHFFCGQENPQGNDLYSYGLEAEFRGIDPEEALQQTLQENVSEGEWIVCDHNCRNIDHAHSSHECSGYVRPQPSAIAQKHGSIYNSCVHHQKMNPADEIRLIRPYMVDNSLHVMMKTIQRHSDEDGYMALSYVWGDLTHTEPIHLEHICRLPDKDPEGHETPGVCLKQRFNITKGLANALRALRCWTRIGWLWVDAVSINQYDSWERGRQVSMMGNIYAEADFVLIWLNDIANDAYLGAATAMAQISHLVKQKQGDTDGQSQDHRLVREDVDRLFQSIEIKSRPNRPYCDVRSALAGFFNEKWFRRIWVLQEVCKANANAIVLGPTRRPILFSDVVLGYYYTLLKDQEAFVHRFPIHISRLWLRLFEHMTNPSRRLRVEVANDIHVEVEMLEPPQRDKFSQDNQMDILELFSEAIFFEATVPRDKLFAILSMATDLSRTTEIDTPVALRPDYTKSTSQVFVDFTWFIIKRDQNLSFLQATSKTARQQIVGPDAAVLPPNAFPSNERDQEQKHPTWALWYVPRCNWTDEACEHTLYPQARVSPPSKIDMRLLNDQVQPHLLPVRGLELDEVDTVLPYVFQSHETGRVFKTDEGSPVTCAGNIALIWEEIVKSVQRVCTSQKDARNDESSSFSDAEDAEIFDRFLLTIICDKFLPEDRYGLQLRPEDRARPSLDEAIMTPFLAFWSIYCVQECECGKTPLEHRYLRPVSVPLGVRLSNLPRANRSFYRRLLEQKFCTVDSIESREDDEHKLVSLPQVDCKRGTRDLLRGYPTIYTPDMAGPRGVPTWLHHTLGRCFFVSKKGQIGLCPYGTKEGDRLVALQGARMASVLRPRPEPLVRMRDEQRSTHEDHAGWAFVGEAFVQAWMDGRFVDEKLGPEGKMEDIFVLV